MIHRDPSQNTHALYDRAIVRLIQEMWALQLDFWRDYQKARHQPEQRPDGSKPISEHSVELHDTVKHLYSFQSQVEVSKEEVYFPRNLDEFLETNNTQSITNYIKNYGKAILASAKRRTQQTISSIKPLWQFPGYSRSNPNTTTATNIHTTATTQQNTDGSHLHGALPNRPRTTTSYDTRNTQRDTGQLSHTNIRGGKSLKRTETVIRRSSHRHEHKPPSNQPRRPQHTLLPPECKPPIFTQGVTTLLLSRLGFSPITEIQPTTIKLKFIYMISGRQGQLVTGTQLCSGVLSLNGSSRVCQLRAISF
jgi:hypothetical protein